MPPQVPARKIMKTRTNHGAEIALEITGSTADDPSSPYSDSYPALHRKLDFYTLSITRAHSPDGARDGYMAYLQPSFGAASGESHEVWAATLYGALEAVEKSVAAYYAPNPPMPKC
jgi:hypothetical protein